MVPRKGLERDVPQLPREPGIAFREQFAPFVLLCFGLEGTVSKEPTGKMNDRSARTFNEIWRFPYRKST